MQKYADAYEKHRDAAREAYRLFVSMCDRPLSRVPGMDTVIRLAWRLECGRTVESAAAAEYLYRWSLAVKPGDQVMGDDRDSWDRCKQERELDAILHGAILHDSATSIFGTPHAIGM